MTARYARQMLLPEVGAAGQARLAAAHVAVIGAGGLGCPVVQYLAGAGVGRLTILDPDHVEESNLHRQPIYTLADLGRPKADAAAAYVRAVNPGVTITAQVAALGPSSAAPLVADTDLVIDAADSFAVSYILSDACFAAAKPLISASVLGQTGYVGGFCGGAPSLRAVFPDLPTSAATCASAGVLGPVVGVIGSLQAQLAVRVLLGADPNPLGQMVSADLAHLRFGSFSFLGSPEPDDPIPFLDPALLVDGDRVIELRDAAEAPEPIIPQALRMSQADLGTLAPCPNERLVLACRTGLRAWHAATALRSQGHSNLALMAAQACG